MADDQPQDQPLDQPLILPIIDSHIHLYPASENDNVAWLTPDHALAGQRSVDEFRAAARSSPSLLGYVLVEADRKSSLDDAAGGWDGPLQEVRMARRIAAGQPRDGDGHGPDDAALCLGIVPWAPLPAGAAAMESYLARVEEEAGDAWPKVKGFRYLVQDKPHGTMLGEGFIEGLRLLGRRGFVFEIGVDQQKRGKKQLEEMVEMIDRAHDGVPEEDKVAFVVNHLCKPDLSIYNITSDPSFHAWRTAMYTLGKCSKTYMKLSGLFPGMPESLRTLPASRVFESTLGWLGIVLATFGPARIMFGSDWPVCTPGVDDAWAHWRDIVDKMCWMASLGDEDRAMIFGGTAKKAYGL